MTQKQLSKIILAIVGTTLALIGIWFSIETIRDCYIAIIVPKFDIGKAVALKYSIEAVQNMVIAVFSFIASYLAFIAMPQSRKKKIK